MVSDWVRDTGAPPTEAWKLSVAVTGTPLWRLNALRSAFSPDADGLAVNVTMPARVTTRLPRAKTILAGRHFRLSLTKPGLHLETLAANTPNRPFWKVSSHLSVPARLTDCKKVI